MRGQASRGPAEDEAAGTVELGKADFDDGNTLLRRTGLALLGDLGPSFAEFTDRVAHLAADRFLRTTRESPRAVLGTELEAAAADLAHLEAFLVDRARDAGEDRKGIAIAGQLVEAAEYLKTARDKVYRVRRETEG